MIIGDVCNLFFYEKIVPNLAEALEAVRRIGINPALGRYDFDGGYFMVQEGNTRPVKDGDYEAHCKYIDVQIILEGSECVVWEDIKNLQQSVEYAEEKDRAMYTGEEKHIYQIEKGMFWVAFPHDAHKACRDQAGQNYYKKIVLKLPYNSEKLAKTNRCSI